MPKPIYLRTLIQAHRGASAYAPENTLEAFGLAAEMKADGVELDVWMTADGYLAVNHDGALDRVSGGEFTGRIKDMTLADIKKASVHARFKDKYYGVRVPTLDEVFELLRPTGLFVNVELKDEGEDFVREVAASVERCRMKTRVIYSSFKFENLTKMKEIDPDAFTAPLYGRMDKPWEFAASIGAGAIHPEKADVLTHGDYIENAHALGIRVHPWTVDDDYEIRELRDLGVDAVITNRPDAARDIILE
jgi:glycerophosphoryl diester phosphodiesterase